MFRISVIFLRVLLHSIAALTPIWMTFILMVSGLGLLLARLEGLSWTEGLYFAWVTGTTIGYGDITPVRGISRLICILVGCIGVLFTGTLVAVSVNALKVTFGTEEEMAHKQEKLREFVERIRS